MAPKVLHHSNKKAKKCQKGAIKVYFKELKVPKKIATKNATKNLFKGLQVWLQMAPNGKKKI